jgi:hypothetical protein
MLTSLDPDFDRKVRNTIEGMAHWAGTGPAGTCCGDCVHLVKRGGLGGYICGEFARIMGYSPLTAIPRQTKSCSHFEARTKRERQIDLDQNEPRGH